MRLDPCQQPVETNPISSVWRRVSHAARLARINKMIAGISYSRKESRFRGVDCQRCFPPTRGLFHAHVSQELDRKRTSEGEAICPREHSARWRCFRSRARPAG